MEITKTKPLKVLFYGWPMIQHSYGIVLAFQLIHLYKNYGPEGIIKRNAIEIYIQEAKYYNDKWYLNQKLVYPEEYNEIIRSLKIWDLVSPIDLIYRATYPYNISSNDSIPKCIFYTSEFAKLTPSYFSGVNNVNEAFEQIKHKDLYFTSPSVWSSLGLKEYLPQHHNRIITHGVDTQIFFKDKSKTKRNIIRKRYCIKETDVLMINIGATTTNKGILLIIEALHILVNKMDKKEYKIMFKGSDDLYECTTFIKSYFQHFIQNNIISENEMNYLIDNNIIFTNKTLSYSTLNDLFNACDLYISPYLCEGFNLCPLEFLATGGNVLVPHTGSTKEYIEAIYQNGGKQLITYVDSQVGMDPSNGFCQNIIKIDDLVKSILSIDFITQKNDIDYKQMLQFIKKELSWNHVSILLFDYFQYIINKTN
jgi:glycosyltransferase involved in cell wall biosynthesis